MRFQKDDFLEYYKENFSVDNFYIQLIASVIDYGEEHHNTTKKQIVYFIYDILSNVEGTLDIKEVEQFYY
ncbi:hypothetical protein HKO22_02975 [Peptoniphilus sp. AGMB00490]|uniref:Uncharacterized protein n=1 Tax=Peptoniphilus faecalis TaxID=2731255 RepID=A0A848R622_9FIRM|nr:hypothetical protein [Peptoniphilus faecalis]NMW84707.1 hypothetical protein [Peptoniphilus faecalis]